MGESRRMLRLAYSQGVRSVIATPHYSDEFRNDSPGLVLKKCRELESWAEKRLEPGFRVYPGQEIFASCHMWEKLERRELLTMAYSSCILLEFLPSVSFTELYQTVRKAAMSPYRPILAHVERYRKLREKGRPEELIEAGAMLQMNYQPIGGKWYEERTRWCRRMLKDGYIHFLGTDMHGVRKRAPETEAAMQWMKKHLDESYLEDIKAIVNPLDQTLRSLVDTDEEADKYMNIVFELCTAYERQSYIERLKVGARLMVELMEGECSL